MLRKDTKEEFLKCISGATIACIGAGGLGKRFASEYPDLDMVFFDNDEDKIGKQILQNDKYYDVMPVDNIMDFSKGKKIVIVITAGAYAKLYVQLMKLGMGDCEIFIYPFVEPRDVMLQKMVKQCLSDYYYHNHMDLAFRDEFIAREYSAFPQDAMVIPYFPVYITTRCTLNCEKCNNLMPYLKSSSKDFDADVIIKSLSTVLSCVHEMTFCELVGGEPFLYNDLAEILDFVGNQKKIRQIVIVTNGTIVPDDDIMERLKKYNVLVRISDYGLFEKMSRLVVALEKRDINVRVLQDMKWNDPGDIESRGRTSEELYLQYNKCVFSLRCKYLAGDKLFTCARIASMYLLGRDIYDEDVMAIDDTLTADKIRKFYLHDSGRGCDHCDLCSVDAGGEIPAAVQMGGKKLPHSQYTIIRNDYLERLKKK